MSFRGSITLWMRLLRGLREAQRVYIENCGRSYRIRCSRREELKPEPPPATIFVQSSDRRDDTPLNGVNPFQPGAMALVNLGNPRERFWGAVLFLSAFGLTVAGNRTEGFEDCIFLW